MLQVGGALGRSGFVQCAPRRRLPPHRLLTARSRRDVVGNGREGGGAVSRLCLNQEIGGESGGNLIRPELDVGRSDRRPGRDGHVGEAEADRLGVGLIDRQLEVGPGQRNTPVRRLLGVVGTNRDRTCPLDRSGLGQGHLDRVAAGKAGPIGRSQPEPVGSGDGERDGGSRRCRGADGGSGGAAVLGPGYGADRYVVVGGAREGHGGGWRHDDLLVGPGVGGRGLVGGWGPDAVDHPELRGEAALDGVGHPGAAPGEDEGEAHSRSSNRSGSPPPGSAL